MDWGRVLEDAVLSGIGVPAAVYALAAVGLNVHFGYTGLLNFGHVGFLLIGAYGTAISVDRGLPLWLGVVIGVLAAVALGLLMGIPTLRLRADYLAIVTISVAEILRLVANSGPMRDITGGATGIRGISGPFFDLNPISDGRYGFLGLEFSHRRLWLMAVGWGMVVLTSLLVYLLMRSPWGRVIRAIREDEDAARSLGKNVFAYKLQSLALGGAIGSLGGILFVLDTSFVAPAQWLAIFTFFTYTIVVLGGPGRVLGPIVGAMLFWFGLQATDSFLRQASAAGYVEFLGQQDIAAIRFALVGLVLMLLMIFRPQGIFGDREEIKVGRR